MKNKIIMSILAVGIAASMMAGCGSSNSSQATDSSEAATEAAAAATTQKPDPTADTESFISNLESENSGAGSTSSTGNILTVTEEVNLRSEASTDSDILETLPEGTQVEAVDFNDGWCQVNYDGQTGYVNAAYLQGEMVEQDSISGIVNDISNENNTIVINLDGSYIQFDISTAEVSAVDEVRVGDRVKVKYSLDYGTLSTTQITDYTLHDDAQS